MTNKRISILSKLIENDKIIKIAQEVGSGEGEIDKTTADRLAEEVFDKLFDDELKRVIGS
jgi:hypothetical protein